MSSDLDYYIANKSLLLQELKHNRIIKNKDKYVGLKNHGATCYLNSLLQTLYYNKVFRNIILNCDNKNNSAIILELQMLFSRLLLSNKLSVDTNDLLSAFGWSNSQLFEQHDVQEFFSVLLDALGKESESLDEEMTKLFQGSLKDTLKCTSCDFKSEQGASFLNISVDVPDHLEGETATCSDLSKLITAQLSPEQLDEDNKWACSKCGEKVKAEKSQEYRNLPELLLVHLKRFRFDPITKRRRKLTTAVSLPAEIDADAVFKPSKKAGNGSPSSVTESDSNFGKYELASVIIHTGTAMGGHYRSYTKVGGADTWVDCNDESVVELTEDEVKAFTSNDSKSLTNENAYVLLYKRSTSDHTVTDSAVPSAVKSVIDEENAAHAVVQRLYDIQQQIYELTVHLRPSDSDEDKTVELTILKSMTLKEVTSKVYQALSENSIIDSTTFPESNCRLRKFFKNNLTRLGETFDDMDDSPISVLGLAVDGAYQVSIAMEIRRPEDPEFVEFNPNDMFLTLIKWDGEQQQVATEDLEVLVPGRETATVASLRAIAAEKLSVSAEKLLLVFDSTIDDCKRPCELLHDLNTDKLASELMKDHRIFPGSRIVVEVVSNATDITTSESSALKVLEEKRLTVTINFNNPLVTPVDEEHTAYDKSIQAQLTDTLATIKGQLAQQLGIDDSNSFFLKRSAVAPQFKDESKTLEDLAIVNHGVLHLQMGSGCKVGEHLVRFELDTAAVTSTAALATLCTSGKNSAASASSATTGEASEGNAQQQHSPYVLLSEIAISEKSTVLQVKQQLCDQWSIIQGKLATLDASNPAVEAAKSFTAPASPHFIRLRDGKGGKISGPLRDDRLIGRCLLGLVDGRRIVVQLLEKEELIGADDLVVSVRVASYQHKTLTPPVDIPISRSGTVKNLYEKVLELLPHLNETPAPAPPPTNVDEASAAAEAAALASEIAETLPEASVLSLAKGFTSGPPLTLKNALKLKWDEPGVLKSAHEATLDRPPLNLRDGSIVVVRSKADFQRAQEIMRAKKQAAIEAGTDPSCFPHGAGAGSAAVRAKSRARSRRRPARPTANDGTPQGLMTSATEKSLKIPNAGNGVGIAGADNNNNDMPPPSPDRQHKAGIKFEISLEDDVENNNNVNSGATLPPTAI